MFELSKIEFIGAYLCEMNAEKEDAVISNYDVEKEDDITLTFIENTVINLYASKDMKWARFKEEEQESSKAYMYIQEIGENLSKFKGNSKEIVHEYFKLVKDNIPVPSGDLIVVLFEMEKVPYFGIFKYNHKTMLVSKTEKINDSNNIYISRESSLFTTNRHKADEGFIVNLISMDLAIVDKKYDINSDKMNILQDCILLLETGKSEKEKLDIFNKVTKNIENKYIGEDIEKKAQIKKAVKDTVLEEGVLSVGTVMDKAFGETEQLKQIYQTTLEKSGIDRREKIEIPERQLKAKFQTQKIMTETGIEISIPIDYYGDDSKIEFLPDGNGGMSIIIKNVKNILS